MASHSWGAWARQTGSPSHSDGRHQRARRARPGSADSRGGEQWQRHGPSHLPNSAADATRPGTWPEARHLERSARRRRIFARSSASRGRTGPILARRWRARRRISRGTKSEEKNATIGACPQPALRAALTRKSRRNPRKTGRSVTRAIERSAREDHRIGTRAPSDPRPPAPRTTRCE